MSLHYAEKEDYLKEESINKYIEEFISYNEELPTLSDALNLMFISSGLTEEHVNDLIRDILTKTEEIIMKIGTKLKKDIQKLPKKILKLYVLIHVNQKTINLVHTKY